MILSDVSVKRPVAAVVLSLLLCVFGIVSFYQLSVREMPDIENPVVSISTRYDGASATIIESKITSVLEDQLSGIDGIDEITSTTRTSSSRITITFKAGHDLSTGISDVRDAVARAARALPSEASTPLIFRNNGEGRPSIYINLQSDNLDRVQLTDYVERVLLDRFSLIPGVSTVNVSGGLKKVMYVELDPVLMAGRNVTTQDVISALRSANLEAPAGEIRNQTTTMSVRIDKAYTDAEDFENLVVRQSQSDVTVFLRDIATVQVGAQNETSTFKSNGVVNVSLGIITQSNSNPLDVAELVRNQVTQLQEFLPEGTRLTIDYDATIFIERSIQEVYTTLFISGAAVVLVLLLFLGRFRAALIPAITVPVSLLAAFIAANAFGFSINLVTLMALILSVGLIVDDAIVVVENMYRHIEKGESPLAAAYLGTREVGFAVVSTTLVLVMVFLPLSLIDGTIGLLFTEFAVLLSMAVIISSLIALTLTPVLGSKFLTANQQRNWAQRVIDSGFTLFESAYSKLLSYVMKLRWLAPLFILGCIGGTIHLFQQTPVQLTPSEDRGVLFAFVRGADATSYDRMVGNMEIIESRLLPLVEDGTLRSFSIQTPAFGGNAGDQTGFVIMILKDWQQRQETANQIVGKVRRAISGIPDVRAFPFVPGFRGRSNEPVQFVLAGADYQSLKIWAEKLKQAAEDSDLMNGASINFSENSPELVVNVDPERASRLGLTVEDISQTLEVLLGGTAQTTFVQRGQEYDVYLRGDEQQFNSADDLAKVYLRSRTGEAVSLANVVTTEERGSSIRLSHYDKKKAITLSANLNEGVTLGEALAFLDQQAQQQLPIDISVDYSGESKQFKENQAGIGLVFALALLVAYLVLAAQFESFVNPFVVMLTVPLGLLGGLLGILLFEQSISIYSQIGMLMLIGMVTKNGILIVEFANQLRDKGFEFEQAIIEASKRRLRPIVMTAVTTIVGTLPLVLSTGAGYESRIAVGTVIFAGMSFASLITLLVIPAMYRILAAKTQSPGHTASRLKDELNKHSKSRLSH